MIFYQTKEWIKQVFIYPEISLGSLDYDKYWEAKRGQDMGSLSDWQIERANFVVSEVGLVQGATISDIGCGEGAIAHYIGQKIGTTKLLGTDISDVALDRARSFGIQVEKVDIGRVEELSKIPTADYQILFEILEHVPHSEDLLKEAYGKARRGVFFSFPNTGFFTHRLRLFFGRFPLQWKLYPGEHVRFWTKHDLHWWLRSLGYKNYKVHYYKGIPVLNKIWPSLFAAGFVVFISK